MTSDAFAHMAIKFSCPLLPLRITRTKGTNFVIEILPSLPVEETDPAALVDRTNALLQEWIFENPEQWLWLHRRWKFENKENR
jgi:KDO2-lipid IV(A) lauroyltransferase